MMSREDVSKPGDDDPNKDRSCSVNLAVTAAGSLSPSPSPSISISISTHPADAEIPALAFGLYKVPIGDEGVRIITDAIIGAGYRHLDSASIYGNEKTLGRALADCYRTTKTKKSTKFW